MTKKEKVLTFEQEQLMEEIMEIIPRLYEDRGRVFTRKTISEGGNVTNVEIIQRDEWLEDWLEYFEDRIGEEFDIISKR